MKANRSIRIENSRVSGGVVHTGTIINNVNISRRGKSTRPSEYPAGCIGSNLSQRNYIKYLVERYHRFREADASPRASIATGHAPPEREVIGYKVGPETVVHQGAGGK